MQITKRPIFLQISINYKKAIELSGLPQNKKQKEYYNKILLNLANVYIAKQDYNSALTKLNEYIVDKTNIQQENCLYCW